MSYHSSNFVVERVNLLRQLVREKDGNSRHYAKDSEDKKGKELDKLVRILRPANQQANDHSHAIRLRLRQAILNHPNAGSEGPLLLSRFDKTFESLKRLNPSLNSSILAFLKPLSFKSVPTLRPQHMSNAVEEDRRLREDTDTRLSITHPTALTDPELVQAVRKTAPATHQVVPLAKASAVDLIPSYKNTPLFSPNQENIPSVDVNFTVCWVSPQVEKKLLIDLVYILQGVTGKYIRYDSLSESYLIDPSLSLPMAVRDVTLCICELGWLFTHVSAYLKRIFHGATDAHGLIVQAFGFALQEELQDYYRLLAVLEQEINRDPQHTNNVSANLLVPKQEIDTRFESKGSFRTATQADHTSSSTNNAATSLTLLRLKAWMQEPLERMCLMARLVDGAGHLLGGALASRLHAHARHGDVQYATFVQRIMDSVCSPLYAMCIRWMLHGELHDPHQEFFITANANQGTSNNGNTLMKNPWRDAYMLRPELLPMFLPRPLAEKMLNIGRSINFLKICLQRLPKEKQQYQAYQKLMMRMTGNLKKAKRSFRMINKSKKLSMYGRIVDDAEEEAATTIGGVDTNDDVATLPDTNTINDKESVHSASTNNHTNTIKGGALVPVGSRVNNHIANGNANGTHNHQSHASLGIQADEQYFLKDAFQDMHASDIAEALRALRYDGDLPLSTFVHRLAYQIDTRLLQLLEQRFQYKQHLSALKRFMLLGQGDFVMCLMDNVGPELKKRANQLFRHNLTALLEGALRASNAQYDPPYILDRVHVRLLDASPGDSGWEVFALDYSMDMPLHAIVHPEALGKYRVAFHMLWRLKRVEWSLTTTWKAFLAFAHSHEWKTHTLSSSKTVKLSSLVEVRSIFHRCHLHRAKMMHFVNNLCAFVMFEVLENSWLVLEEQLRVAQSLDQVIDAHDRYLNDILDKALLSPKHETLNMMIQALLQTILRFCSLEETLVADAMALVARQKMLRASQEDNPGIAAAAASDASKDGISATLIMRIDETVRDYNTQFDELMTSLKDEAERSHDFLRYLTFRLDFNGHHQQVSVLNTNTTSSHAHNSSSTNNTIHRVTLANETAADRRAQQASQARQVTSVRPGSAVSVLTNNTTTATSNNNSSSGEGGLYYTATAPATSSKVPQHHADVLAASHRYK